MKLSRKIISRILVVLFGLATILVYVWYTYDYIFGIDQTRRTKWLLAILAIFVLILPWEVLLKLLFRLFENFSRQTLELNQRFRASIKDIFGQAKSRHDQSAIRSILTWIVLAILAHILNYFVIHKIPFGYDLHVGIDFLVLMLGIYAARKIVRSFLTGFFQVLDDRLSTKLERNFLRKPNIIRLTTYLILIGGGLMVMESWIYKPLEQSVYWDVELNDNYENQVRARIEIDNFDLSSQTIDGHIDINEYGQATDILIDSVQFITVNNQIIPLDVMYVREFGFGETRTFKSGKIPFRVNLYGDSYLFPFVDYQGEIRIAVKGYWPSYLQPDMDTSIHSQINSVNLTKGGTNHNTSIDDQSKDQINIFTYQFSLTYIPYFRVLFITVFFILLVFLLAVWKTKKIDQVMGLSIGIFATLYTIKGWVIPSEIGSQSSPLLFDRISLIYIVVFLASLLYKYSNQND